MSATELHPARMSIERARVFAAQLVAELKADPFDYPARCEIGICIHTLTGFFGLQMMGDLGEMSAGNLLLALAAIDGSMRKHLETCDDGARCPFWCSVDALIFVSRLQGPQIARYLQSTVHDLDVMRECEAAARNRKACGL